VGRFRNFTPRGGTECDFGKHTFIYGDNARGKSTLTAILRSLNSNKPDYIIGRKSFGSSSNSEVTLILEDGGTSTPYNYSVNQWTNSYPNFAIFDSRFVSKNVYSSESITPENEKAIESIILGETGRKLDILFWGADKKCQDNTARKGEITREYTRHLGHYSYQFPNFRQIKIDPDIETKLEEINKNIKANESRLKIVGIMNSFKTKLRVDRLEQIKTNLLPTIKVEQAEIKKHILDNFNSNIGAENFLSLGKNFLKSKSDKGRSCVFCGQPLTVSAEQLIDSYQVLFSQTYEKLVTSLSSTELFFNVWKIESEIKQFLAELETCGISLSFNDGINLIDKQTTIFKQELNKKSDLNYQIDFSSLKIISDTLNGMEVAIDEQLKRFQNEQSPEENKQIIINKNLLELTKFRGQTPWIELCKEYNGLETETDTLSQARVKALKDKNTYSEDILKKYEIEVNNLLIELHANFKLVDTKPKSSIRDSSRLFGICFDTNKVSLSGESDAIPNFSNSLSESDKRLLSFAFFLAGLKVKGNISTRIVVLDDPVSSYDDTRKLIIIRMLRRFFDENQPNQLLFLTHDMNFLAKTVEIFSSFKCFKIDYDPSSDNSVIKLMDVEDECQDNFYRQLTILKKLETASDSEINCDKLRPIRDLLEELFKKKYYFYIKDLIQTTGGGVASYTGRLKEKKVYTEDQAKQMKELLANFWNHDDSTATVKKNNYQADDIRAIITNFFKALEIL